MAKIKSVYVCQSCGYKSPKWVGQCSACKEWNTLEEELEQKALKTQTFFGELATPQRLQDIVFSEHSRQSTYIDEFDRVLGGGLVPGALILIGGEPGIGKSTLALQAALAMQKQKMHPLLFQTLHTLYCH